MASMSNASTPSSISSEKILCSGRSIGATFFDDTDDERKDSSSIEKITISSDDDDEDDDDEISSLKLKLGEQFEMFKMMHQKDNDWFEARGKAQNSLNRYDRAIALLECYKLCSTLNFQRETFHLTVDYFDRYCRSHNEISAAHVVSIALTCLHVAGKVEEVIPFSVMSIIEETRHRCEDTSFIAKLEKKSVLPTLGYRVTPMTAISWLGVYMQFQVSNRFNIDINNDQQMENNFNESFLFPQFSAGDFVRAATLLDLCTFSEKYSSFKCSVLAASAIWYIFDAEIAVRCSGIGRSKLEPCVNWMRAFYVIFKKKMAPIKITKKRGQSLQKNTLGIMHICPTINTDLSYRVQSKHISEKLLNFIL